jgi:D-alanyl-D-alanine carboxypeptidase
MRVAAGIVSIIVSLAVLAPPSAKAGPALLLDADSGKVLYAEDQDALWHPASLTKIMTAYLTFAALKSGKLTLETKIPYSENASQQAPSKVGLPVGAEMGVETALKALIIKSANDVAVMLAEAIGGSEAGFADMMNATARRLGMTRSHFVNPNGLPNPEQVTTARDLARLARAVMRDYPEHAHYWSMPDMRLGKRRLASHNTLLRTFEGADGLKTGFICDSGYNVVATATRDGRRLMAVVLGEASGNDRNLRAASLLEHGYQSFGWKQLFNTTTLDTLQPAAVSGDPANVRDEVKNFSCNGKRRGPRAATVAKARAKAKATRIAKKAKAGTAGVNETGSVGKAAPPASVPKPVKKPQASARRATDAQAQAAAPGNAAGRTQ